MVQNPIVWYDMVPYGIPHGTIGYKMVSYGTIWYHIIWVTAWYHMLPYVALPKLAGVTYTPPIRNLYAAIRQTYTPKVYARFTYTQPIRQAIRRALYARILFCMMLAALLPSETVIKNVAPPLQKMLSSHN